MMILMVERFFVKCSGTWYNDYFAYRHRIHDLRRWQRWSIRLLMLPATLAVRLFSLLRRRLEIPQLELVVSTRCNLNCRDCANLIPFYASPGDAAPEQLKADLDDFLQVVDRVHRLIIMGGETFLYPYLADLLRHVLSQPKVGLVQLFTNGTIIPGEEIRRLLRHPRVMVTVSNFPDEIARKRRQLLQLLRQDQVNLFLDSNLWSDLGGFAPTVDNREGEVKKRFAACFRRRCHNLLAGEYHLCPRSAHGKALGQFAAEEGDYVLCRGRRDRAAVRQELKRLFRRESLAACRTCLGQSGIALPPGIQMEGKAEKGGNHIGGICF